MESKLPLVDEKPWDPQARSEWLKSQEEYEAENTPVTLEDIPLGG